MFTSGEFLTVIIAAMGLPVAKLTVLWLILVGRTRAPWSNFNVNDVVICGVSSYDPAHASTVWPEEAASIAS